MWGTVYTCTQERRCRVNEVMPSVLHVSMFDVFPATFRTDVKRRRHSLGAHLHYIPIIFRWKSKVFGHSWCKLLLCLNTPTPPPPPPTYTHTPLNKSEVNHCEDWPRHVFVFLFFLNSVRCICVCRHEPNRDACTVTVRHKYKGFFFFFKFHFFLAKKKSNNIKHYNIKRQDASCGPTVRPHRG